MTIIASSRSHRGWSRWIWIAAAVLVGLLLIPYVLTPLYLIVRPVSTLMLWRWATGARVERIWVPLEQIARPLPLTVIAAEDARYCRHRGVDFREIREAIEEADDFGDARGGSTIAQQTAKNLFLWPGRSLVRKALELPLALWLDLVLGKRRLLEIYLNIVEWGPDGQFGAEAGASHAFGRSARDLSAREAATLAAILPAPRRRDARRPGPQVRRLAAIYERRAARAGALDDCIRGGRA